MTNKRLIGLLARLAAEGSGVDQFLELVPSVLPADLVLVLRKLDDHTVEPVWCFPDDAILHAITMPSACGAAFSGGPSEFLGDYGASPEANPLLAGWGVRALAILPIAAPPFEAAVLIGWRRPRHFTPEERETLAAIRAYLLAALPYRSLAAELERATGRLAAILETVPQGVLWTGEDGGDAWLNAPAAEMLNLPAGNIPARHLSAAMRALAPVSGDVSRLALVPGQYLASAPGDRILRITPRDIAQSSGAGRLFVLDDLTGIQRQHEAVAAERDRAESATRAKTGFLAAMSHEIRTPMNGLLGMAHLLLDTPLTPEQKRYIEIIANSGDALLRIINSILDFSKVEAGKVELELSDFVLRPALEEILELLSPSARRKHIDLVLAVDDAVPAAVRADGGRVRQILLNFLNNAIKFTPSGEVRLAVSNPGPALRFAVEDSGPGISESASRRLFQTFSQADASTSRTHGGTGLGLAIAKGLAELMGGSVGFANRPEGGSVFWAELPLPSAAVAAAATAETAPTPASRPAGSGRGRILLAEDNPTNQLVGTLFLKRAGCEVATAANGALAVEAWRAGAFDLILMDCEMPELDGFEAAARIRELEAGASRRIPIVALTANVVQDVRDRCREAGMDDYLSKPIDPAALSAILDRWL